MRRHAAFAIFATGLTVGSGCLTAAHATPSLVADLVTGEVLAQEEATRAWYPASLTKLVTVYVALKAVREGRVTLDTPFVMSARAARAAPSKMGFNPGTEVTLDNALKMLMVKSANDLAIMIAEGISGSVEDFAGEMNATAAQLGMTQSHFVNPNGLFDPAHVSSARDMAIVARALYMDFPQQADLYGIGALRLGDRIIPTHNGLIGRYPGADGMKTGFVCASGFNVVGSAQRGGRHIVVVVLGSPNAKARTVKAANLFDAGFAASSSWRPTLLTNLPAIAGPAPNLRADICGRNRKVVQEDDLAAVAPTQPASADDSAAAFFANDGRVPAGRQILQGPRPTFEPIDVFVGRKPGWTGAVAQARATSPSGAMVPATAAAFADPRQPVQLGIPPVAGSALPRGLSANRGVGAIATRAIDVKARDAAAHKPAAQTKSAKLTDKPAHKADKTKAEKPKAEKAKSTTTAPAKARTAASAAKPAPVKLSSTKPKAKAE